MAERYTSGCLLCGKPLVYSQDNQTLHCALCGRECRANVHCEDGHYVCDECHAEKGLVHITAVAMQTDLRDPVTIAQRMMDSPHVNMHGPEHHYLVPAALLAAYRNAGGNIDFDKALTQAQQRASEVPGGICGMWGSCGAGIGAGIFVSVATGATPLSEDSWSLANRATSESLAVIAQNGGPRCCKRDSFLSLRQAAQFANQHLDAHMAVPESVTCTFYGGNRQCRQRECLFFPKR